MLSKLTKTDILEMPYKIHSSKFHTLQIEKDLSSTESVALQCLGEANFSPISLLNVMSKISKDVSDVRDYNSADKNDQLLRISKKLMQALDQDPLNLRIKAQMDTLFTSFKQPASDLIDEKLSNADKMIKQNIDYAHEKLEHSINSAYTSIMSIFATAGDSFTQYMKTIGKIVLALLTAWFSDWNATVLGCQMFIIMLELSDYIKTPFEKISHLMSPLSQWLRYYFNFIFGLTPEYEEGEKIKAMNGPEDKKDDSSRDNDVPPFSFFFETLWDIFAATISIPGAIMESIRILSHKIKNMSLKEWADLGRNLTGVKALFTISQEIINCTINFFKALFGYDYDIQSLAQMVPDLESCITEYIECNTISSSIKIHKDPDFPARVERLYYRVMAYNNIAIKRRDLTPEIRSQIRTFTSLVSSLQLRVVKEAPYKAPDRSTPLFILLSGPPGCTKTAHMRKIGAVIQAKYYPTKTLDEVTYNRTTATAFWDGYTGQEICYMNELYQKLDTVGSANEDFISIIQCVDSARFQIPVAEAEKKQFAFFKSDWIIGTTNARKITCKSLESPSAILRRTHIEATPFVLCPNSIDAPKPVGGSQNAVHCWEGFKCFNEHKECPDHDFNHVAYLVVDPLSQDRSGYLVPKVSMYKDSKYDHLNYGPIFSSKREYFWSQEEFVGLIITVYNRIRFNLHEDASSTKDFVKRVLQYNGEDVESSNEEELDLDKVGPCEWREPSEEVEQNGKEEIEEGAGSNESDGEASSREDSDETKHIKQILELGNISAQMSKLVVYANMKLCDKISQCECPFNMYHINHVEPYFSMDILRTKADPPYFADGLPLLYDTTSFFQRASPFEIAAFILEFQSIFTPFLVERSKIILQKADRMPLFEFNTNFNKEYFPAFDHLPNLEQLDNAFSCVMNNRESYFIDDDHYGEVMYMFSLLYRSRLEVIADYYAMPINLVTSENPGIFAQMFSGWSFWKKEEKEKEKEQVDPASLDVTLRADMRDLAEKEEEKILGGSRGTKDTGVPSLPKPPQSDLDFINRKREMCKPECDAFIPVPFCKKVLHSLNAEGFKLYHTKKYPDGQSLADAYIFMSNCSQTLEDVVNMAVGNGDDECQIPGFMVEALLNWLEYLGELESTPRPQIDKEKKMLQFVKKMPANIKELVSNVTRVMRDHPFALFFSALTLLSSAYLVYRTFSIRKVAEGWSEVYDTKTKTMMKVNEERRREFELYGGSRYEPRRRFESKNAHISAELATLTPDTISLYSQLGNNLISLTFLDDTSRVLGKVHGLMISGTVGVTVKHAQMAYDECEKIQLASCATKKIPSKIFKEEFEILPWRKDGNDIMAFKIKTGISSFPNISTHFSPASVYNGNLSVPVGLISIVKAAKKDANYTLVMPVSQAVLDPRPISYSLDQEELTNAATISYSIPTDAGSCGSLLFSLSNLMQGKIIGIHIAGSNRDQGYSTVITKEDISSLFESTTLKARIGVEVPSWIYPVHDANIIFPEHGNFLPLGVLDSNRAIPTSFKSKLEKTEYFGMFGEPCKKPALLHPREIDGQMYHPLLEGLKKSTQPTPILYEEYIDVAVEDLKQKFRRRIDHTVPRVLTDHEAIHGIAEAEFFDAMAFSKSPGWPLSLKHKDKRSLLDADTKLFKEEIMSEAQDMVNKCKNGEKPLVIFSTFLKDEKLDARKVDKGKARVVYCAPLVFLFVFRKYFLSFAASTMHDRIDNDICVGIDPNSQDWTFLVKHLKKKGNKVFAGDFAGFDYTENFQILTRVVDIINEWYDDGEENALIRSVLWSCVTEATHLFGKYVYSVDHCLPSGQPLTAIGNSIYVLILFRYIWQDIHHERPSFASMRSFNEHVSMAIYGDDHVVNVSEEASHTFNQNTVVEPMKRAGMTYTDELKTGDLCVPDTRKVEDVSFLKRRFVYNKEINSWLAPLDLTSIDESVYYTRKSLDFKDKVDTQLYENMCEYANHGEQIFKEKRTRILKWIREKNIKNTINLPTYREVLMRRSAILISPSKTSPILAQMMRSNSTMSGNITHFQEDTGIAIGSKPLVSKMPTFTDLCTQGAPVERGVRLATVAWGSASAPNFELYSAEFPDILLANAMILRKVQDFRFMKADITLRILINAPPTSTGKAWCYFDPLFSVVGNRDNATTLCAISAYPGMEIDAGCPSTVQFNIPYCAPNTQHDLKNDLGSLGRFVITVINPFNSVVGTDTASIEIYGALSNVTLSVPTPNITIAQMDTCGEKSEATSKVQTGMISTISQGISQIAKGVAKIPILGAFSPEIAWVADAVTNASSSIGFSVPNNLSTNNPMYMLPGRGFTNGVGLDNGVVLGVHPANTLKPDLKVFSTKTDEMDIAYVCAKECLTSFFAWSTTQPALTILKVLPVTPGCCADSLTGDVAGKYNVTLMNYVASMFRYWRGSIHYRISAAKNRYYSGRLGIAFVSGHATNEVSAATNFDATYRVVLDLTENSEASIVVNYETSTPWLTVNLSNRAEDATLQTPLQSLGSLVVYVENPLACQDNVPQSMYVNIWTSGGSDMKFAVPDFNSYRPSVTVAPMPFKKKIERKKIQIKRKENKEQINKLTSKDRLKHFKKAQVGNDDQPALGAVPDTQLEILPPGTITLNCDDKSKTLDPEMYCMGESVSNLRVLARRFGTAFYTNDDAFSTDTSYFGDYDDGDANVPLYYISFIYRLFTGSRRYKLLVSDIGDGLADFKVPDSAVAYVGFIYNTVPYAISSSLTNRGAGTLVTRQALVHNRMVEVMVPYYRNHIVSLVSSVNYQSEDVHPVCNFQVFNSDDTAADETTKELYVAGGDDFSFGYLVGPPGLVRLDGQ